MKTILIAEDNDSNFILMSYLLKKHYNIIRAKNGKEAVDYAANGGFEIILMDIKMPEMDGLEATKIIKKECPTCPSSPSRQMPSRATASRHLPLVVTTSCPSRLMPTCASPPSPSIYNIW